MTLRKLTARWALPALVLSLALVAAPGQAGAIDELAEKTSLGLVPDDVAFYAAMFNQRRTFDAVAGSNAFQRLVEQPALKEVLDAIRRSGARRFIELEGLPSATRQPSLALRPFTSTCGWTNFRPALWTIS